MVDHPAMGPCLAIVSRQDHQIGAVRQRRGVDKQSLCSALQGSIVQGLDALAHGIAQFDAACGGPRQIQFKAAYGFSRIGVHRAPWRVGICLFVQSCSRWLSHPERPLTLRGRHGPVAFLAAYGFGRNEIMHLGAGVLVGNGADVRFHDRTFFHGHLVPRPILRSRP